MIHRRSPSKYFLAVAAVVTLLAGVIRADGGNREIDGNRLSLLDIDSPLSERSLGSATACLTSEHASADDTREPAFAGMGSAAFIANPTSETQRTEFLLCPDRTDALNDWFAPLDQLGLSFRDLPGKRVLSLGEGTPNILLDLIDAGADAYALDIDPSYKDGTAGADMPLDRDHLIPGDATDFSKMAFARGGFDQIVSSHLLCELDEDQERKVFIESLRVLRPGGTARHLVAHVERGHDPVGAARAVKNALQQAAAEGLHVKFAHLRGYMAGKDNTNFHDILIFKRLP